MNQDIHPSSVIEKGAVIGKNVKIGPFCLIGGNVVLGDNVQLHSHICVEGRTKIGENTRVFPFASIGHVPQDLKYKGEESTVQIGKNNTIREYVTIQPGTEGGAMTTIVGDNNLLMAGVHIAHDCIIGNNCIFANLATLAGHVVVGDYTVIGGLAAIHQNVRIGQSAMIGGLSPVARDVAPFATINAERASVEGMNILGLKRRGYDKEDIITLQKAFKKIFFDNEGNITEAIEFANNEHGANPLVRQLIDFLKTESLRSFTTAKDQ